MFENTRQNKIKTLEPKKQFFINDINIQEIDFLAVSTLIAVPTLFLLSMELLVLSGI